jgi:hypothetical protein
MVKDVSPRLLEWIAYHHHFLGVEHFVLYDNNSTDGTVDVLRRAGLLEADDTQSGSSTSGTASGNADAVGAKRAGRGLVTRISWEHNGVENMHWSETTQHLMLLHCLKTLGAQTEVLGVLDVDEYIQIGAGREQGSSSASTSSSISAPVSSSGASSAAAGAGKIAGAGESSNANVLADWMWQTELAKRVERGITTESTRRRPLIAGVQLLTVLRTQTATFSRDKVRAAPNGGSRREGNSGGCFSKRNTCTKLEAGELVVEEMGVVAGQPCARRAEGPTTAHPRGRTLQENAEALPGRCIGHEKLILFPRNVHWFCQIHELCVYPDLARCVHPSTYGGKRSKAIKARVFSEVPPALASVAHYSDVQFGEYWATCQNSSTDAKMAALVPALRAEVERLALAAG